MARIEIDLYVKSLLRRVQATLIVPSLDLHGSMANKDDKYYQNRDSLFPLMIFLHGFGDSKETFLHKTIVEELCEKNKVAALFVNGDNKWYLNHGGVDNYYDFIENDILDYIYGNFKNLSSKAPLIIGGVSMGGYGALYHYLKNTSKYSGCFALSPATKPDFIDESKIGSLRELFLNNKGNKLDIYLSVGKDDFIIEASKDLDNFLKNNDIGVRYRFIDNYPHSWDLWRIEIVKVFDYFKSLGLFEETH